MNKTLILMLTLLITPAYAGVIEFQKNLNHICGKSNQLVNKKILLKISESNDCDESLIYLLGYCEKKINCNILFKEFSNFKKNKSSVLIGE